MAFEHRHAQPRPTSAGGADDKLGPLGSRRAVLVLDLEHPPDLGEQFAEEQTQRRVEDLDPGRRAQDHLARVHEPDQRAGLRPGLDDVALLEHAAGHDADRLAGAKDVNLTARLRAAFPALDHQPIERSEAASLHQRGDQQQAQPLQGHAAAPSDSPVQARR